MIVSEALPGDVAGVGTGPEVLSIEQESIRRAVAAPGVTFVLGPAGTGKTAVALQAVRDVPTGRVFVVRCGDAGSLDEVERGARAKLGTGQRGDVVILDGLDEFLSAPSLERLTRFTQAPWLGQAHVLILSRTAPEGMREAFRRADTPRHHYSIVELRWSYANLIGQLWAAADGGRHDGGAVAAIIELLESAGRHPAVVRALMSAVQSQLAGDGALAPDLMFVPDRSGLIRVLPSTGMELTGLQVASGRAITATPRIAYRATRGFWLPEAAGRKDRVRVSAHVAEALSQVREYRAYFDDSRRRQAVQERYGLQAYRPTAAVLIGRDPGPGQDKFELKRLWDELPGHVRIITYDELLRQVRSLGRF